MSVRSFVSLATVLSLAVAVAVGAEPAVVSPFAGTWKLDPERSDDLRQKMRENARRIRAESAQEVDGQRGGRRAGEGERPRGEIGRRPGGGGPGGSGRAGGERPDDGDEPAEAGAGRGRGGFAGPGELIIDVAADSVTIRLGDGPSQALVTDGGLQEIEGPKGGMQEIRASWDGERLVVATKSPRGRQTETYEVGPSGDVMTVKVERDLGRMGKVSALRVYDRVVPDPAPGPEDGESADAAGVKSAAPAEP